MAALAARRVAAAEQFFSSQQDRRRTGLQASLDCGEMPTVCFTMPQQACADFYRPCVWSLQLFSPERNACDVTYEALRCRLGVLLWSTAGGCTRCRGLRLPPLWHGLRRDLEGTVPGSCMVQ